MGRVTEGRGPWKHRTGRNRLSWRPEEARGFGEEGRHSIGSKALGPNHVSQITKRHKWPQP